MRRKITFIRCILIIFLLTAFSTPLYAQESNNTPWREEKISEENLTILGFTLNECTVWDILFDLGGVRTIKHKVDHDFDSICYKSTKDNTIVVFRFFEWEGGTLRGFALMSEETDIITSDRCREIETISRETGTQSGIKLGIKKDELKKILGVPTKETDEKLIYRNSWYRKMTEEEIEEYSELFGESVKKNPNLGVAVWIDAIFSHSGLEWIEIVRWIGMM